MIVSFLLTQNVKNFSYISCLAKSKPSNNIDLLLDVLSRVFLFLLQSQNIFLIMEFL